MKTNNLLGRGNNNNNNNNKLSLPEMFSAGAAFQRSFTVQQFAGL